MNNQITFDMLTEEYKLSQIDAQYILDFIEDTKNEIQQPIILLFYGDGNNGKSHLLNRIQKEIGYEFAIRLPITITINESVRAAILLIDKKLAVIDEPESGDTLPSSLKSYLGGEHHYNTKTGQTFTISTNFIMCSNSLDIFGNSEGLRRRTKIINFPHHF